MALSLVEPSNITQGAPDGNGFFPTNVGAGGWGVTRRPRRDDFPTEKEWLKRLLLYYCYGAEPKTCVVHAMQREGMALYMKHTGTNAGKAQAPSNLNGNAYETNFHYQNYIYNIIRNKSGQFSSRAMNVSVSAWNSHADSRKQSYLAATAMDKITRELLGDETARSLRSEGGNQLPDTEALEREFGIGNLQAPYKDKIAASLQNLLKDWMKRTRFDLWAERMEKQFQITGTVIAMPRVNEATMEVELPALDCWDAVFDVNQKYDNFQHPAYSVTLEYRSVSDVLYAYPHITEKELEQKGGGVSAGWSFFGYPAWRNGPTTGREVLVLTGRFVVNEKMEVEAGEDYRSDAPQDNPYMVPAESEKEKKTHVNGEQVYEVVLLGGDIVASAGKLRFQARPAEQCFRANLGVIGARTDQGVSVYAPPLLVRVGPIQDYMSLILKKIAEIINDIGPDKIIFDKSQIVAEVGQSRADAVEEVLMGWSKDNLVKLDFAPIDEMQAATRTRRDFITVVRGPTGEQLERLAAQLSMWQQQLYDAMSWNPQAGGNISPYQAEATARLAVQQAGYGNLQEAKTFKTFLEETLTQVCNLLKLVEYRRMKDKERKPIALGLDSASMLDYRIGDNELYQISANGYLTADLGIEITIGKPTEDLWAELKAMAQVAMQAGSLTFLEYIQLIKEDDPYEAMEKMEKLLLEKEKRQAAMEVAKMEQANQQMAMQAEQMDADRAQRMQADQMKAATSIATEQMKIEGA